jgi:hypothetical protein
MTLSFFAQNDNSFVCGNCELILSGAFAVYTQAVWPTLDRFDCFEVRVGIVAHLGSADVGKSGGGELLGQAFVVPHPEMAGSAEEGGGQGFESSRECGFAEEAVLHEARRGAGGGIVFVGIDELLEVWQDHAEGSAGTEVCVHVADGEAELVQGHVLEDVGAIDGLGGLGRDRQTFDDVAVEDVFGVRREAPFDQDRSEKWEAALNPEGGASVEVLPGFRSTHATTKLHILVTHGRIIHSVRGGSGSRYRRVTRVKRRLLAVRSANSCDDVGEAGKRKR